MWLNYMTDLFLIFRMPVIQLAKQFHDDQNTLVDYLSDFIDINGEFVCLSVCRSILFYSILFYSILFCS